MSLSKVDPMTGELTKISGLVDDTDLKQDIADIQAVIPSGASSSNQLVTDDDVADETLTSATTILAWASAATTTRSAFIGTSDQPSDAVSGWGEHIVTVYGKGTRKIVIAMDYSVATQTIYTRKLYNGAWTTSWTKAVATADGLTSSVTSGSTAPVTSGGVYSAINTITTGTITDKIGTGENHLYKNGKTVTLDWRLYKEAETSIASNTSVGTIPTGYRPRSNTFVDLANFDSAGTHFLIIIESSGNVKIVNATTVSRVDMYMHATWITT